MAHLAILTAGAQVPVTIPEPGTLNGSALDTAYAAGQARDPGQVAYANHVAGAAWPIPTTGAPELRTPGTPRPSMSPAAASSGPLSFWAPDVWDSSSRGVHVAQDQGASVPRGGQLPSPGPTGNTWRAEPQPWDAAHYVGFPQA